MRITITKNAARCRVCSVSIESLDPKQYEVCSCGSIAISGGSQKLLRSTKTWADLEELSEYLLTWKDVLDCKQYYRKLSEAANVAQITGHMFFVFDENIHRVLDNGTTVKTDKTIHDLPCAISAKA